MMLIPHTSLHCYCVKSSSQASYRDWKFEEYLNYPRALSTSSAEIRSSEEKNANPSKIPQTANFTNFHTGAKYFNQTHIIDEFGRFNATSNAPAVFNDCANDVYWTTNYEATHFRYVCCLNRSKRLAVAVMVAGE